jgi:hypothetical protein
VVPRHPLLRRQVAPHPGLLVIVASEGWRVVPVATSSEATLSIYTGHWTGDGPLLLNGAVSPEIARDLDRVAKEFQRVSSGRRGRDTVIDARRRGMA